MTDSRPHAYTVVNDGGFPIGMFGAIPSNGGAGVWMLGSDHLVHNVRRFYESSKLWIEKLVKEYTILGCIVDARNTSHIRWLEHLGFVLYKVWEKFGAAQIKFIEYHRSI